MDLDKLNLMLGGLLQTRSEDLYRMKGIVAIAGLPDRFVFQVCRQVLACWQCRHALQILMSPGRWV
jgi:G3E family GTPase